MVGLKLLRARRKEGQQRDGARGRAVGFWGDQVAESGGGLQKRNAQRADLPTTVALNNMDGFGDVWVERPVESAGP